MNETGGGGQGVNVSDSEFEKDKILMTQAAIHVIPANGRWAVHVEGESAYSSEHRLQLVAIFYGRELAKSTQAEFVIHGRDRRVRSTEKYDRIAAASLGTRP